METYLATVQIFAVHSLIRKFKREEAPWSKGFPSPDPSPNMMPIWGGGGMQPSFMAPPYMNQPDGPFPRGPATGGFGPSFAGGYGGPVIGGKGFDPFPSPGFFRQPRPLMTSGGPLPGNFPFQQQQDQRSTNMGYFTSNQRRILSQQQQQRYQPYDAASAARGPQRPPSAAAAHLRDPRLALQPQSPPPKQRYRPGDEDSPPLLGSSDIPLLPNFSPDSSTFEYHQYVNPSCDFSSSGDKNKL